MRFTLTDHLLDANEEPAATPRGSRVREARIGLAELLVPRKDWYRRIQVDA